MTALSHTLLETLRMRLAGRNHLLIESEDRVLLCLLHLETDFIGFAEVHGKAQETVAASLEAFKEQYRKRPGNGVSEPAFVLLRCSIDTKEDAFFNAIEIDPYFCKKYVLNVSREEFLELELERLPFLPLPLTHVGAHRRPISAQVMLKRHGVNSHLARVLVRPYERSADGILNDCIGNKYGEPSWLSGLFDSISSMESQERNRVRLKSIEIRAFRAYRRPVTFDTDSDIIILFGLNGLGKTSVYDALDFAFTGTVDRLSKKLIRGRFGRALAHLDRNPKDSSVTVRLCQNDNEFAIERSVIDPSECKINGKVTERKQAIIKVCGIAGTPEESRVENLVWLFRATHFFGQEHVALMPDIKSQSRIPTKGIARMLALQDYVEAINKVEKVLQAIDRALDSGDSAAAAIESDLTQAKKEAKDILLTKEHLSSKTVRELAGRIIDSLREYAELRIEVPNVVTKEVVQEWQARVISAQEQYKTMAKDFHELELIMPNLHRWHREENEITEALSRKTEEDGLFTARINKMNKENLILNEHRGKLETEMRRLEHDRLSVKWAIEQFAAYENYLNAFEESERRESELKVFVLTEETAAKSANIEEDKVKSRIFKMTHERREIEKRLAEYEKIRAICGEWANLEESLEELLARRTNVENLNAMKNEGENVVLSEYENAKATLTAKERALAAQQGSQTELQNVLEVLINHIHDSRCPACGHLHESTAALLSAINSRRGHIPSEIERLQEEVEYAQKDLLTITEKKETLARERRMLLHTLEDLDKLIDQTRFKIKRYADDALESGFSGRAIKVVREIEKAISASGASIETARTSQNEAEQLLKERGEITMRASENLEILRENLIKINTAKNIALSSLTKLRLEAEARGIFWDAGRANLEKAVISCEADILETNRQLEEFKSKQLASDVEIKRVNETHSVLRNEVAALTSRRQELAEAISQAEDIAKRYGVRPTSTAVAEKRENCQKNLRKLDEILTRVRSLRSIIDEEMTSVSFARVRTTIEKGEEEIRKLQSKRVEYVRWKEYLETILHQMKEVRDGGVSSYLDYYAPLASVIQNRLRSVYGFGPIQLEQKRSFISLFTQHRQDKSPLAPSVYFSESQLQILMLSLFLSAAISQTWSAFAPIFVDDPITHFDDLNAYSLLELIKGIVSGGNANQFVVSSCDERFYRLMRKKFAALNCAFYEFKSLGADGPVVVRN